MDLTPVQQKFVLHWGDMGARWGINRSMGQIHALLMIADRPLDAEEIAETLSIARSNVSTSLRELRDWGIVETASMLGERREHFTAPDDPWEMLRTIMHERVTRELEPTGQMLEECLDEARSSDNDNDHTIKRLESLKDVVDTSSRFANQLCKLPTTAIRKIAGFGGRLADLLPGKTSSASS
ncbi:MAG: ArsR family transcriptional regulator [Phycisphaeraceae bacterium]|nr:ArsR family transcriptional regulator [Phycisphaeraceae bacterium]